MSLFDLSGKHAVVIAGTSTLGGAMADGLARHGARVAVVGRALDGARAVVDRIEQAGGDAAAFAADVTLEGDLSTLLDQVTKWAGNVHTLINCPGVNSATPFFDLTIEEWNEIMNVNAGGVVRACQVFGKHMTGHGEGGSIINISSASSGPPLSKVFSYSASKAAVDNMTQFLAREFAPHGVRVNAIVPGFFPAEQNRRILSDERVESIMSHTPMARFGEPEELAGTAVWLASEEASGFVTGALIRVDGGFGAMTI